MQLYRIYPFGEKDKYFTVFYLGENDFFPDPMNYIYIPEFDPFSINNEGLFAIGSEIEPLSLIDSYKKGIFPWFPYKKTDKPEWYCPKMRYIINPSKIHISHSMRNLINKQKFKITFNSNFEQVINNCRIVDNRNKSNYAWLSPKIMNTFKALHSIGYAKSVEVWEDDKLVGGLYGFFYNNVFQGESMFSLAPSASKMALIALCNKLKNEGEKIIDCQFKTPFFESMGGEYLDYKEYRKFLDN